MASQHPGQASRVRAGSSGGIWVLIWVIASWLPGVLLWPINLALEVPAYRQVEDSNPIIASYMRWLSSSILLPFILVSLALVRYSSGEARILRVGLMTLPGHRLDEGTRLYTGSVGCGADGLATLVMLSNNAMVYTLHAVLGPPECNYQGPYPSLEISRQALKACGRDLSAASFLSGNFSVGTRSVELSLESAQSILTYTGLQSASIDTLRVAIFDDRCLVVGVLEAGGRTRLILADLETGRPFSYYDGRG